MVDIHGPLQTRILTTLGICRTQVFETRKSFPTEYIEGVAALVLCDFYLSISFIDELPVSKLPTYEYRMVCHYCAENREIEMKKLCLRAGFALLSLTHTDQ